MSYAVRNILQIIDQVAYDLFTVQDDRGLKLWVRDQKSRSNDDFDALGIAELSAFRAAVAKSRRTR